VRRRGSGRSVSGEEAFNLSKIRGIEDAAGGADDEGRDCVGELT